MESRSLLSRIGAFFLDMTETAVIALSVFLVVYLFFIQPHQVSGLSMYPNFHDKEYILTDKITYRFSKPQRGDVIVFHAPKSAQCPDGTGCDFIKRLIGLPGDTIQLTDHVFSINGKKLQETYIPPENVTNTSNYLHDTPITLQDDEYFVVGDNRPHSSDSRVWGPISFEEIVGRGFFRYWPPSRLGILPSVSYQ